MSNRKQDQLSHSCDRAGWGVAIDKAERQIRAAEDRIMKLRLSIDSFKDFQASGEPWPTSESADELLSQK